MKSKAIKAEDYEWFELTVVRKDNRRDFWCRLIATSKQDALDRAEKHRLSIKVMGSKLAARKLLDRYVRGVEANSVPTDILSRYNLNDTDDYELFHKRERG